ncbi:MAG TPA: FAD-binding oxidoreductase [Streptosporangiaceae bacterium]|nr:FAD-binding oxidoreductase [Streptosporangiaceae bacterium]
MVALPDSLTTAGGVPPELAGAGTDVRTAGPADTAGGKQARYVAAPASAAEAAALLSAAASLGLTVVARGSGTKLDWGTAPARCDLIVDTRRLDRVLEHAAGDLVVTVQSGVRLDDLATVLAAADQRLALDPPESAGTIGGLIATGAAGPLRYRYGSPRDLLIGITVVRPDGTIAKSGGKVVKNVAGYDLGKLFAGSLGTLGLITEATFRLHPRPQTSAWLTRDYPSTSAAASAVHAIADSPVTPAAIELEWPSAAAPISVSALLEGEEASVQERAGRLNAILDRAMTGQSPGRPLADGRERPGTLLRVAFWAGQLAAVLDLIRGAAAANGLDPAVGGAAAAGLLEIAVTADAETEAVGGFVAALRASLQGLGAGSLPPLAASAVVVTAPAAVRDAVDLWGPVPSLALMRAVKYQFDPDHRMAPGRFAGGI